MKLNIAAIITALTLSLATVTPVTADEVEEAIVEKLTSAVPGLQIASVQKSEAKGLYEVQSSGGETIYITADGVYLLTGDLLKLTDSGITNVTEQGRAQARVATMAEFGEDGLISYPATGEEKAVIGVFTDIDCPYCRKFHDEIPELNDYGITVNYYGFPRSGPGTPSFIKYESVWCADDQVAAMDAAKDGQTVARQTCDNPVEAQFRLGARVGVTGTPAILLEDGNVVPGYVPASNLAQRMGLL